MNSNQPVRTGRRGLSLALPVCGRPSSTDPGSFAAACAGDLSRRLQQRLEAICGARPRSTREDRSPRRLGGGEAQISEIRRPMDLARTGLTREPNARTEPVFWPIDPDQHRHRGPVPPGLLDGEADAAPPKQEASIATPQALDCKRLKWLVGEYGFAKPISIRSRCLIRINVGASQ